MKPFKRHVIFLISAAVGFSALVIALLLKQPLVYAIGPNVFFITYAALMLHQIPLLDANYLSRRAQEADEPLALIYAITLVIVAVAVGSLFMLINAKEVASPTALVFSMISLPLGWFTIHAMAALHYAHLFWRGDAKDAASTRAHKPVGGLLFPLTDRPIGWDFLYFAVVIGMTAQTADTNISSTAMRKAVLAHSILSFFFNTAIVAAAVNLIVSLPN
ncbi:DUF1345 domain-containing protein [Aminobacter sp. HY435]|uniref:DUF1345 domain-containing protein n=1 Tax=Aminobacter sp. HY435 TaxID=2970917 RepID=UPI0022B9AA59|nr:DUF1345 domain-containing protein [Aminobacter sp. HY435]